MTIELRFMSRFKLLFCAWLEECGCPFPLNPSVAVQQEFLFLGAREACLAKEDGRPMWGNKGYKLQ